MSLSASEAATLFAGFEACPALVLAVSGGPDSTALMVLAARWRAALKQGPVLLAVTVDHGLRPESKREARDVATLARSLGIAHRTLRWTGAKPVAGLPQAARQARYRLLAQAARRAKASHVLTAHTLDDQAETVMIRMMRGSGLTGLAAMQRVSPLPSPSPLEGEGWGGGYVASSGSKKLPPSRRASRVDLPLKGGGEEEARDDILLLRPFLTVPKARLIATLANDGIAFADDPTNRDIAFTRARLRGLMPRLAGEGLDAGRLSLLARRLRRADAAIEAVVDVAMAQLCPSGGPSPRASGYRPAMRLDAERYFALPAEIALRLLGRGIAAAGDAGPVELAKLEALHAALDNAQNTGDRWRRTLAGAVVTRSGGQIVVERAPPRRNTAGGPASPRRRKSLTKHPPGRAKPAKTR